jgi:hypothetical protein
MVVNFQVADLKEGTQGDLISAKNELSQLANDLVRNLDGEINEAIQNLEGTLTESITSHINSTNNPHSVSADQLNISTVGKTGDYGDLSNIPSEFNPSSHSHEYNTLTGIPNLFAPSAHSHAMSDITDLSTTLEGKASKVSLANYATKVSLGNIVPGDATTSASGLMSSGDKTKLDGIPSGGGGGGLIDIFSIRSTTGGHQSHNVPNYDSTQRLYIMMGDLWHSLPAGTSSTVAFSSIYLWVDTSNGQIKHYNAIDRGIDYYSVMRFSA